MAQQSLKLLKTLMSGHQLTSAKLDQILTAHMDEDLFLEYKHGKELQKKNAAMTIRQYLSGFANSAGGVLIIDVDEATWSVTQCIAPGGGDLADWASRCLTPVAHYFSPPPRFQVVSCLQGNVLVAAVERSMSLVPCVENGTLVYYLRIHDQTLKAPDYLMSDILLGRRNRSDLYVKEFHTSELSANFVSRPDDHFSIRFETQVVIENKSLSWAEDARIGIVSWSANSVYDKQALSDHLRSYIDVGDDNILSKHCFIEHKTKTLGIIGAFDSITVNVLSSHELLKRKNYIWFDYRWQAALYLVSKESLPIWYQLEIQVGQDLLTAANDQQKLSLGRPLLLLDRKFDTRLVVSCADTQCTKG
ncbi:MAG: ATP-binding protein [Chloroflexales bacterium]|nr:ATP-binding protein [Chloroflexales bacterium]